MIRKILGLVLAGVFFLQVPMAVAETLELGILPLRKPTEMMKRFKAVEQHLQKETGLDIRLRLYPTTGVTGGYTAIVKDVAEGKIAFAFLAPVTCIQAAGVGPVVPFACAQKKGSPIYYGHLGVKADSEYKKLSDLKGKKVCGTSASSTSGSLMPTWWLKDQGIDKFKYFQFEYLGRHDKAAQAVITGNFAGCFINEATFNQYNKENEQLRSLWRHPAVPEFPFCVNTKVVSKKQLAKVKKALLKMHEADLEGVKSANPKYDKWVSIELKDYKTVKDACDTIYGKKFYDLEYWQKNADK